MECSKVFPVKVEFELDVVEECKETNELENTHSKKGRERKPWR